MLQRAKKLMKSGVSIVLGILSTLILGAPSHTHAQSMVAESRWERFINYTPSGGFKLFFEALDELISAGSQVIDGVDVALNAMDALTSSGRDKISDTLFGLALREQLRALDRIDVPPPNMSEYVVSLDAIANPSTRCQGFRKLENGAQAVKAWLEGSEAILAKAPTVSQKLKDADRARSKLQHAMEKCISNGGVFCQDIWHNVWEDSPLAKDISNAMSAVKLRLERVQKDRKLYLVDLNKKSEEYSQAVNWVRSTYPNIRTICEREEIFYMQGNDEDQKDLLAEAIKSSDNSAQERQVAKYLNGLGDKMAATERGIDQRLAEIQRWKEREMAELNQAATALLASVAAGASSASYGSMLGSKPSFCQSVDKQAAQLAVNTGVVSQDLAKLKQISEIYEKNPQCDPDGQYANLGKAAGNTLSDWTDPKFTPKVTPSLPKIGQPNTGSKPASPYGSCPNGNTPHIHSGESHVSCDRH